MKLVLNLFFSVVELLLILIGALILWKSQDLMLWLIYEVGEEYVLGKQNVIRLENGGKLLTNPGAMIRWSIPFWIMGFIMIV